MIILKKIKEDDLMIIYDLKKETYRDYVNYYWSWDETDQRSRFLKAKEELLKHAYLIYRDDVCVGFYEGKEDELINLCLYKEFQNQGIGSFIIKKLMQVSPSLKTQCFKINPVYNLYKRLGFKDIKESDTHYILGYESSDIEWFSK